MIKRALLWSFVLAPSLLQTDFAEAATYSCAEYLTVPALSSNSSSLVAASAMAAHCFGRGFVAPSPGAWESGSRAAFTSDCVTSSRGSGVAWPGSCNPNGALYLLNSRTGMYGHSWVPYSKPNTETDMGRVLLSKMSTYKTPIVLPYVGNWDHWVTVTRVDTMTDPSGSEQFVTVRLHDGLPIGWTDSGGKPSLGSVFTVQPARNFVRDYMGIMSYIGAPCHKEDTYEFLCAASPYNDPWYFKWLFLYEPPAGSSLRGETTAPLEVAATVAPLRRGQAMTANLALAHVMDALRLSGALEDPGVKQMMINGRPQQAVLVRGTDPHDQPLDYYLIPITGLEGGTTGFVAMSAIDGALESAHVLDRALPSPDFSEQLARSRAQQQLGHDEQLGAGILSWRPISRGGLSDSPVLPYYEFAIQKDGAHSGLLRVALHDPKLAQRIK